MRFTPAAGTIGRVEQLLFMADYPECEPCLWRIGEADYGYQYWKWDGSRYVSPVSDGLEARIARWVLVYVDHWEDSPTDDWSDEEIHERWLQEGWELLREINAELLPAGVIVRPSEDFMSPRREGYGASALSEAETSALIEELNTELRRRGIPAL